MKIGIDASNLREGGGVTHLTELLHHADDHLGEITKVIVWGGLAALKTLPDRPWLDLRHEAQLDGSLARRLAWQSLRVPTLAKEIDLWFAPGGIASARVRPRVVMSRNMLPFEASERRRFGIGPRRARIELLRHAHRRSFSTADGVIFLTEYAQRVVCESLDRPPARMVVIPHGISERFRIAPRPMRTFSTAQPLRILYVSVATPYKHQRELVAAIGQLRQQFPIELTLIGPSDGSGYLGQLRAEMAALDPNGEFLHYLGKVAFDDLHRHYRDHDVFAFASSCENMPNILVEAMASGLPIACARRGPMPEMLGDAGVYFDPESPSEIATALRRFLEDDALRVNLAGAAYARALRYSWSLCARDTFSFLQDVAISSRR